MPLPMRLVVVSWPATNSSTTVARSSSSVSRSPSSSAASSADSRSSRGCGAALLEDAVEVVDERHEREQAPLDGGLIEVAVEHAAGVGAPRTEEVLVLGGDAEQLADHGDRQRVAEDGDQVEARGVDPIEHPVDQLGDVGAELSTVRGVNALLTSLRRRV